MESEKRKLLDSTHQLVLEMGIGNKITMPLSDIVSPEIVGLGTAIDEKIFGMHEVEELLKRQKEQTEGIEVDWNFKTLNIHISPDENTAVIIDEIFLKIVADEELEMYLRFSMVLEYVGDKWFLIHWHGSKPEEVASEEDTWGIESWKEKAKALEKEVAERTSDLLLKNRELEIEAALERVRAASMATHKSEELQKVVSVLFEQLQSLNFALDGAAAFIATKVENFKGFDFWLEDKVTLPARFRLPYYDAPSINDIIDAWEKRKDFLVKIYGKEKNIWFKYAFEHTDLKIVPEDRKEWVLAQSHLTQAIAIQENSMVGFHAHHEKTLTDNEIDILKRFSTVFEQSFVRFLDLQKAEEQAREAQIEVALERVRSRSLAMHKTDELQDIVRVVAEELKNTGVILDTWGAVICTYFQDTKDVLHWTASEEPTNPSIAFLLPYFEDELFDEAWESKVRGDSYFAKVFSFEVKNAFFNHAFTHSDYRQFPDDYKKQILESETHGIAWAWAKNSAIMIPSIQGDLPSEEEKEVLIRFARVFEQSFIRFLDLQKAEAQAREAEIEAALEKVRSRSLAMHKSDELNEVVKVLFEKMIELQVPSTAIGIQTFTEESKDVQVFVCGDVGTGIVVNQYLLPYFDHPILRDYLNAHKEKPDYFVGNYPKKEKDSFYDVVLKLPELKDLPNEVKTMIRQSDFYEVTMVPAEKSLLAVNDFTGNPLSESHINILKRFTKVFDQTYIRFLDLQKAEARAKESQIETALERVRSRTMGMQQSEELGDVATVLFNEMNGLVDDLWTCGFVLCEENRQEDEWWLSMDDGFTRGFFLPNVGDFAHETLYEGWEKGESFRSVQLEGKKLDDHYQWLMKMPVAEKIFIEMEASGIPRPKWQKLHAAYFKTGYLVIITEVPCAEEEIFKRFAQVFDLTYTRFLDLQQKEEQGKKLIEEKIRLERTLKDLQATQAQLIQAEKMASLGELTAGIAHEIQNPLNFVNNFSEVSGELVDEMNEELEKGDIEEAKFIGKDLKDNLSKITLHGKRADAIVKGMLEHSRANKGEKAPTDLNALANEFLKLSYHGLRAKEKSFNADFKLELDPTLPKVNVIASDIGRVILNLVNNAFYAVNDKSKSGNVDPDYKPDLS